jgi:hypothetical protein
MNLTKVSPFGTLKKTWSFKGTPRNREGGTGYRRLLPIKQDCRWFPVF